MEKIEKVCYSMAYNIGVKANKTKEEINIINYGLFMIIHTILSFIMTIIIGFIINKPIEIIIISVSAAILKRYSGGVHATSPNRCLIIGLLMSIITTYIGVIITKYIEIKNIIIFFITSIIISINIFNKKAPVGSKNKPLTNIENRKILRKKLFSILKIYYIIIIAFSILILSKKIDLIYLNYIYCLQLGVLLQVFSLTKIGEFLILKIDYILQKVKKGD